MASDEILLDEHDEIAAETAPFPWGLMVAGWLAQFLFLPLGVALGLVSFASGEGPGVVALAVRFLLFWGVLHGVLLWPLLDQGFKQRPHWSAARRAAVFLGLLAPPLVSFLHYQGQGGLMTALDWALWVGPALWLSWIVSESGERTAAASLFLAVSLFVPWSILGDELGPFRTTWHWLASDGRFYGTRALVTAAAVAGLSAAIALGLPRSAPWWRSAGRGSWWLLAARLPWEVGAFDPFLVLYPWAAYGLMRGKAWSRWVAAAALWGELGWLGWRLVSQPGPTPYQLAGLCAHAVSVVFWMGLTLAIWRRWAPAPR